MTGQFGVRVGLERRKGLLERVDDSLLAQDVGLDGLCHLGLELGLALAEVEGELLDPVAIVPVDESFHVDI